MDDEGQGNRAGFRTTRWSVVLAAGDSAHPGRERALASLCETYWYPAYAYARRRGNDADAARDLVQDFFAHLLEKGLVRVADPERGRFRSFLLTTLKNFIANQRERERAAKRGAGLRPLTLDAETAEDRYRREPVDERTPDLYFERHWALALLDRTMARLRQEMTDSGNAERFERLAGFLTGDEAGTPYRRIAAELGSSESAIKVAVHRMRKRYGILLREEVGHTVDDPGRVDDEIRHLFAALER